MITEIEIKARMFDNIISAMDGVKIGKRLAEKLVGGKKRLEKLNPKLTYSQPTPSAHAKWMYDAGEVLKYCRNVKH
jgi:hypothetical protein